MAMTDNITTELIDKVGGLSTLIEALGGILILYLIFNIINSILGRKKQKELEKVNKNLEEIKKLLRKKKKKS